MTTRQTNYWSNLCKRCMKSGISLLLSEPDNRKSRRGSCSEPLTLKRASKAKNQLKWVQSLAKNMLDGSSDAATLFVAWCDFVFRFLPIVCESVVINDVANQASIWSAHRSYHPCCGSAGTPKWMFGACGVSQVLATLFCFNSKS